MKLSSRLQMVANQITEGMIVADIGTDHGYIPIYQIVNNLSPMGYACDVNEGPLKRALENVNLYGVREKITLLLSNGLAVFEKGEYILFIRPNENDKEVSYPFEYSFKVDMINLSDMDYGTPVFGGSIKDYYDNSVIFQNNIHDNTRYLSYECKKDGYYKICYDIFTLYRIK